MRVAVIHNLPAGGARRVLAEHVRLMELDFVEVCLATATPVTDDATVIDYAPRADALPERRRPPARYLDHRRLLGAWREVAARVNTIGVDVVLAHPCRYLQAPFALTGVVAPSVYFCHEARRVDYEPAAAASRAARTRLLYAPLYRAQRGIDRMATAAATTIVTNSRHSAAAIDTAYGRDAQPMPLGIGAAFTPGAGGAGEPRHLLSVGALLAGKGHDLVIETAARTARHWPVAIVTPRPDPEGERALRALARERGVTLDVLVAITDHELAGCYRDALATLYLARDEPYGLASIEAQACGCPVVVSAQGGLPETIEDGVTGFAVARDAVAAAAAVDRLADEAGPRARMSTAAATRGAGLTWEASAAAMEAVLRRARGPAATPGH